MEDEDYDAPLGPPTWLPPLIGNEVAPNTINGWLAFVNRIGLHMDIEGFRAEARSVDSLKALFEAWVERVGPGGPRPHHILAAAWFLWEAFLRDEPAPELLAIRIKMGKQGIDEGDEEWGLDTSCENMMALLAVARARSPHDPMGWLEGMLAGMGLDPLLDWMRSLPDALHAAHREDEACILHQAWIEVAALGPSGPPSANAPCPCGSGKKYKRCCGR